MEYNREPRNNPSPLQSILDRGSKHIQWAKDNLFNKWYWENWTDTCRKMKLRPPSYTTHKNKFKMDQRLKCQTPKHKNHIRKHRQQNLRHCSQQYFLDVSPQARETKEKINKWDYIKLKSFCTTKENINKRSRQPTECKNIFADISDKGLISKTY